MKSHAAERGADLLDLIALNRRYELEDALARRKANRRANSRRSLKSAATRHRNMIEADRFRGERK